jgi:Tol biopolymer transport system component
MKQLLSGILCLLLQTATCVGTTAQRDTDSGITTRISVANDGTQSDGNSYYAVISADEQWITYDSDAATLTPADSNGERDIFLYHRPTRTTALLSRADDGTPGNGFSEFPTLSGDGRIIVYHSDATNLVANDTNDIRDIFLYNRDTETTTRLSAAPDGTESNGASARPAISADGQWVTFFSDASNLVNGDNNNTNDIFLYHLTTGITTLISRTPDDSPANGASLHPNISADGAWIAFDSTATNLVADDSNGVADIFLYERATGTITRLTPNSADGDSHNPTISLDGSTVAYISSATTLVPDDTNQAEDIFVVEIAATTTNRVSIATNGTQGNDHSRKPALSADGRRVAFYSFASTLVNGDSNQASDIFLHDRTTHTTTRLSLSTDGAQSNGSAFDPAISADGHHIVFHSDAATLTPDDTNATHDIFLRSLPYTISLPAIHIARKL